MYWKGLIIIEKFLNTLQREGNGEDTPDSPHLGDTFSPDSKSETCRGI